MSTNQMGMEDYKYEGKQIPMEEIRILHFSVGTQIPAVRAATYKIFAPGLIENKERIECIEPTTETYGSHPRHKLDIYSAKEDAGPILVYFYGGGFDEGDKRMPDVAKGLVYHNVGTYFASRGITTIIPDYRRVNSKKGGEGATFPSGGEDVSLVLKWLETSPVLGNRRREVVLLGKSAGAAHIATYLLENSFLEHRRGYTSAGKSYTESAKESVGGSTGINVKGAILLGLPAHFDNAHKSRKDALKEYYGSDDKAAELSPLGLLKTLSSSSTSLSDACIPNVLALVGEYDPPDEIHKPMDDFVSLWNEAFNNNGIELRTLKGHNHISPVAALMSGDENGEKWAEDVVSWILGHPAKILESAHTIPRGPKNPAGKKQVAEDTSTQDAAEHDEKTGKVAEKEEKKQSNPTQDYSTEAISNDKSKNAASTNDAKTDPTEDYSTDAIPNKKPKGTDPTQDYSTDAIHHEERAAGTGKADAKTAPAEDYSTDAIPHREKKPADPSEDTSTREAREQDRIQGSGVDGDKGVDVSGNKTSDPTESFVTTAAKKLFGGQKEPFQES